MMVDVHWQVSILQTAINWPPATFEKIPASVPIPGIGTSDTRTYLVKMKEKVILQQKKNQQQPK